MEEVGSARIGEVRAPWCKRRRRGQRNRFRIRGGHNALCQSWRLRLFRGNGGQGPATSHFRARMRMLGRFRTALLFAATIGTGIVCGGFGELSMRVLGRGRRLGHSLNPHFTAEEAIEPAEPDGQRQCCPTICLEQPHDAIRRSPLGGVSTNCAIAVPFFTTVSLDHLMLFCYNNLHRRIAEFHLSAHGRRLSEMSLPTMRFIAPFPLPS